MRTREATIVTTPPLPARDMLGSMQGFCRRSRGMCLANQYLWQAVFISFGIFLTFIASAAPVTFAFDR